MGKICSSEEDRFRRADKVFGYLQHSFFSGLLRKKFHGGNGAEKAKSATFWCCTNDTVSSRDIQLKRCFRSCLQHKTTAQLGHVYKRTPAPTIADRQYIEISYTKRTEK